MGSKNRISKYILPIILENRAVNQWCVEPFVGGANIIDKVDGNRIGSDSNEYLIELLNAAASGWMPDESYCEEQYNYIKDNKNQDKVTTGYAGFALSYGGKFFGGWCRDKDMKRDYPGESYRNAKKQFPRLKGVEFRCCSYADLKIPDSSIIYCDPPYKGCTGYSGVFNHDHFWDWCRGKSKDGHKVFVSEYTAPGDFDCVWQKEISSSLTKNTGSKHGVEKLFVHNTTC